MSDKMQYVVAFATFIFIVAIFIALYDLLRLHRKNATSIDRLTFALYTYASNQQELAARVRTSEEAKLNEKATRRATHAESAARDLHRTCAAIIRERRGVKL